MMFWKVYDSDKITIVVVVVIFDVIIFDVIPCFDSFLNGRFWRHFDDGCQ